MASSTPLSNIPNDNEDNEESSDITNDLLRHSRPDLISFPIDTPSIVTPGIYSTLFIINRLLTSAPFSLSFVIRDLSSLIESLFLLVNPFPVSSSFSV